MALSVVRCPFCDRRYNVTGIPSGTKVLCTSCRAVLTVPPSKRPAARSAWWDWRPHGFSAQVALGVVAGLAVATVSYFAILGGRPAPALEAPIVQVVPPNPAAAPVVTEDRGALVTHNLSRDEHVRRFTESVYNEFGVDTFVFDTRPASRFMLAGEWSPQAYPQTILQEYQEALESLQGSFRDEFSTVLDKEPIREMLRVIVFTRRETFDECQRRGGNLPLPPEVTGLYMYGKQRVELCHSRDGYPIQSLLHEAVHSMVHYYVKQRADARARQAWWFQEGVASYFEHWRRNGAGYITVDPHAVNDKRLQVVQESIRRGDLPPLYQLMAMDLEEVWRRITPSEKPEDQKYKMHSLQLYYGEAWALVHYLRHGAGGRYRGLFDEYFRRELQGKGGKDEFIRLLAERHNGRELGQLQIEFEEYVAGLK